MKIAIIIIVLFIFLLITKTILIRNKENKTIKFDCSDINDKYASEVFELIKIKTPSNKDGTAYHLFREKMKEIFPLVHEKFEREKCESNVIYTYDINDATLPHILLVSHMDTLILNDDIYMTEKEIFGEGSFDSKAMLYSIFKALEEKLKENLRINITIIITTDDKTTRIGNEMLANYFTKTGRFFDLVLEDGTGIIDPNVFGLKSNHALIGIGVTGEVEIRYRAKKTPQNLNNLKNFIEDVKSENIFKSEVDKNTSKVLKTFAKDMSFKKRLLFSNPRIFSFIIKRIINNDKIEIVKLLKTRVQFGNINEDENYYYCDTIFELASHDYPAEIIRKISEYVQKYNLNYQVLRITEPSKVTSTKSVGYKKIKSTIIKTFKDLYIAPYIITKFSERRYFTKVSDCVIRFSPLYYKHQMIIDAFNGKEHLNKSCISYAINFYKNIIESFEG